MGVASITSFCGYCNALSVVFQVLADIWYDGYDSVTRCHVYNHKEFGLIIDNYHLIENPKQGDLYEAWIACVSTEIPGCRWALSGNQKTPLLLKSETPLPASKGDNSRDDRSRSQFSSPHRPSRAGNNGAFRRRSSSSSASRGRSTDEEEDHYENGRRNEPPRNQSSRGIEADGNDRSDEPRRRNMTRNDSPFSRGQSTDSEREVKGIHGQVPVANRLIKCFLEFSKHPNVNRAMRLDDVEKFEDLLKDVEDFKKITS
uniref:Uncharacterized protein n=1 Tax=Caenorhabditis japonica TaxID=281687 RepID=A0A8R1ET60_CAEJA